MARSGNSMEVWLTVVPAYGRDYKTPEAAAADWLTNRKDFRISDVSSPWNGSYVNQSDLERQAPQTIVKIRFDRLARFVVVEPDGSVHPDDEGSDSTVATAR